MLFIHLGLFIFSVFGFQLLPGRSCCEFSGFIHPFAQGMDKQIAFYSVELNSAVAHILLHVC
jgi:hypothetical protein